MNNTKKIDSFQIRALKKALKRAKAEAMCSACPVARAEASRLVSVVTVALFCEEMEEACEGE